MVTYGDLMSLLLCFFVMLVSMSSMSESKFKQAMGSLLGALGVMKFDSSIMELENPNLSGKYQEEVKRIVKEFDDFKSYVIDEGLEESIEIVETDEGMLIRMENTLLFSSGEAEMNESGLELLARVADILLEFDADIRIEGHTDNVPIHTEKFPSNWELSAERAVKVLKYLNRFGIPGKKFTAIGRGEYSPLVENDTEEHRSQNRRVEIFVDYKKELKKQDIRHFSIQEG